LPRWWEYNKHRIRQCLQKGEGEKDGGGWSGGWSSGRSGRWEHWGPEAAAATVETEQQGCQVDMEQKGNA
jgi:hypothetical protein